ncbi:MAG: TrmH family RNA methyltransferase [Betaproteobacteria bacterium]|jgi:tRNA G18 (ribose-2'-O)-methylase SpoU
MNYSQIISETASKHFNVGDEFKENDYEENVEICKQDSLPFAVGAMNVTGDLNLGMMIRSASLMGAERFFYYGRKKYDKRSTVGAQKYLPVIHYPTLTKGNVEIWQKAGSKYIPIFVEQTESALGLEMPVNNEVWSMVEDMGKPLFIFGSESEGIPNDFMLGILTSMPGFILSLPQRGVLRSFNVSSAMSVVCWEYTRHFNLRRNLR